jgi:hypothetical protein
MPRITIYIPDAVDEGLRRWPEINKSNFCSRALAHAIRKRDRQRDREECERKRIAQGGAEPAT